MIFYEIFKYLFKDLCELFGFEIEYLGWFGILFYKELGVDNYMLVSWDIVFNLVVV